MQVIKLTGTKRTDVGKTATKADRAQGIIPCALYGGTENINFTTNWNDVRHLVYAADFKIAEITVDGETFQAILKETQFHPATEQILHIDFLRLIPGHPIKVNVPLTLIGTAPGVKSGGKLIQSVRKIKVKTLPENLIDEMQLDISSLELGQTARVRDIIPQDGIEVLMAPAIPVVLIEIPRALRAAAAAEAKAATKAAKKK